MDLDDQPTESPIKGPALSREEIDDLAGEMLRDKEAFRRYLDEGRLG